MKRNDPVSSPRGGLSRSRAFSPRTNNAPRVILIAIALVALAAMFWVIRDAILVGFAGIVVATLLNAMAEPLSRKTGISPRWSLAIVVVVLLIAFGLLGWLFGAKASEQFAAMRERLPAAIEKVQAWLEQSPAGQSVVDMVKQGTSNGEALSSVGLAASAVLGGVGNLLLIFFTGVYFALAPSLYLNGAVRLIPPRHRPRVKGALVEAGAALRKWLVAQVIVMFTVGLLTGIGLALLDVPLALSLALLVGLLEFVPVIGPIAAAIPGVLLAFSEGPQTAAYAALVYIVVQQIESNLLTPLVQRWAVELPPVVALLSILAAGLLFGPLGVLFATPLAVVVMVLVRHLYIEDTLEAPTPKERAPA